MSNPVQISILDAIESARLADEGLSNAISRAEKNCQDWTKTVYNLFLGWLSTREAGVVFRIEQFRDDCLSVLPVVEKSNRAYGFISIRAKKAGLIEWVGTVKSEAKSTHGTPVNCWRKK